MMTATASTLTSGSCTLVGSLPHRDARRAAEFAWTSTDLPCAPSLPRRSPAESMVAQAIVGIRGINLGQYGSLSIDVNRVDPLAPVRIDLEHDAFGGFRAWLDHGREHVRDTSYTGPVKWQFIGPVSLGRALVRAGVPTHLAFSVAVRTVREHLVVMNRAVREALPDNPQVVIVDEPDLGDLEDEAFPIAPDTAIDLMSGALAAVERDAIVGLHSCADVSIDHLVAAGPHVLSVPVSSRLVDAAVGLAHYLDSGGWVAWGSVATDGPMGQSVERWGKRLASAWCGLVQGGCDAARLRQQSILTPDCGLALHSADSAALVVRQVRELAERVRTQALVTRLNVGA
ncbi:MAG: hypothetical protein RIS41_1118 [Actinomycetota bacterium]|jgi:hypothetical protein